MADIVGELERRGDDLEDLRLGLIDYLRRIASGQLLPDVVVRYAGQPNVLKRVAVLPIADQRKLVTQPAIDFAVWRGDSIEWKKVDPSLMTTTQLTQVLAPDHIRTRSEQVTLLEHRREMSSRQQDDLVDSDRGGVKADRSRGRVILGSRSYTPAEITRALSALNGYESEHSERTEHVLVKLSSVEHKRLKQKALDGDSSMQELGYAAFRAAGLI